MLPLIFQIHRLENTLGGLRLFLWTLLLGAVVGLALSHYLLSHNRFAPSEEVSTKSFYLVSALIFGFLTPSAASMLNHYVPSSAPYQAVYVVTGKCVTSGSRGGPSYFLLFHNGNTEERVHVSKGFKGT